MLRARAADLTVLRRWNGMFWKVSRSKDLSFCPRCFFLGERLCTSFLAMLCCSIKNTTRKLFSFIRALPFVNEHADSQFIFCVKLCCSFLGHCGEKRSVFDKEGPRAQLARSRVPWHALKTKVAQYFWDRPSKIIADNLAHIQLQLLEDSDSSQSPVWVDWKLLQLSEVLKWLIIF